MLTAFLSFSQNENLCTVLTLSDELKTNANAVVRLDQTQIEIPDVKTLKTTYKRIVTVLNKEGDNDVYAVVSYDTGIDIKKLGAIVYDAFGNEIEKYRKSDFKDVSAVSDFSLYEDSRVKYLEYTPTKYPYTVEFYYETLTSNTAYIPTWSPIEGYFVSSENSSIEIIYDKNLGLKTKEQNFEDCDITNKSTNGRLYYISKNTLAVKPEAYSPPLIDIKPLLKIAVDNFYYEGYKGSSSNWEELGKWMYDELLKERTVLPEATKAEIKSKVAGVENPIERAKIVYQYVQDRTRYISVQEGIGGIQPIAASKVDEVKYGDCKGLTNYTKALMDVVGVETYYTRVNASNRNLVSIDKDFVTFIGQTNHVILNIPNNGDDIWLECTSQTSPFNYSANFTDDRDVFVITPNGGKIVHTKVYTSKENSLVTKAKVSIDAEGGISGDVSLISQGTQYGRHERVQDEELKDQKLWYKNYWDHINNLEVVSMKFNDDRDSIVFTENIELKAKKYVSKTGGLFLVQPNVFNRINSAPPRYRERKLPFQINRGFEDNDEYEITLPEGFVVDALQDDVNISNQFGEYQFSITQTSENTLLFKRKFLLNKGEYTKEEYKDFRSFWLKIVRHDKSKIVIKHKS
ncbi:DUF3857 domain-containing protein [Pontimicrobium sp. IMCC45349]|uniref:DUF3857 domain-containing protein n=1 Tax=Pontimicrobium sp. IMCC45349 TaxID=3391574 RepID=UPI0039A3949E